MCNAGSLLIGLLLLDCVYMFMLNLDLIAKPLKSSIGCGLTASGMGNGRRETLGFVNVLI